MSFLKPMYVAKRGDPELEALLAEGDDYLASNGIDPKLMSFAELTKMPKTPGPSYAIPPKAYWPNIIPTGKRVQRIRKAIDHPLSYRGYRPPDYNLAVGGARGSRHQDFRAVDIYVLKGSRALRRTLALLGAGEYLASNDVGLGVYGALEDPSNIHLDTGFRKRAWENASTWIERRAAEA